MKKVLITGSSDGIGAQLALRLNKDGHSLILCGRDETKLKAVADQCGDATYFTFDLNDKDSRDKVTAQIEDLDVLINNAGIWHKVGDLETISEETVADVINTNLVSQILLTKALLPQMRSREGSAIINVISKSGIVAQAGQAVYTASKYGMRGFTDVLREDTEADPIRVAGVYQSGTNTKMFEKTGEDFPVETFTEPQDLADVIAYMLSRPEKLWLNEVRIVM